MPLYEYKCDCGHEKEQHGKMATCEKPIPCECGGMMQRCISLPNTDLVDNVRYSSSMGCNPQSIDKNMRKYPGSRYTPDGRLIVRNRKEKLKLMKQRKMTEIE